MKKIKKILAAVMTLAMVLGMSMTTLAADIPTNVTKTAGKITVNGLTKGEDTTVKIYKVVGWDQENSTWTVEDWARQYVDTTKNPVDIKWSELYDVATDDDLYTGTDGSYVATKTESDGSVEFDNLGVGAYMIKAVGSGQYPTTYNVMGTFTYGYDANGLMVPTDIAINAKPENYKVVKTFADGNDAFVGRGDTVTYNIDAVFPSFGEGETDKTFSITDKPTGLKITDITVTVGGTVAKIEDGDYTLSTVLPTENDVTINFTNTFIEENHAGEAVHIEVTATVVGTDGSYKNEVDSNKSSTPTNPPVGDSGSITIKKWDADGPDDGKLLDGAYFSIAQNDTKLTFVKNEDGSYALATDEEIKDPSVTKYTEMEADNGTLVVYGLDEGTYQITEEQAPDGYSVVEVPDQTITNTEGSIDLTVDVTDTKLHSLPSTGGIGTTIFTIGGCIIMIAAAGLFFASRRKSFK